MSIESARRLSRASIAIAFSLPLLFGLTFAHSARAQSPEPAGPPAPSPTDPSTPRTDGDTTPRTDVYTPPAPGAASADAGAVPLAPSYPPARAPSTAATSAPRSAPASPGSAGPGVQPAVPTAGAAQAAGPTASERDIRRVDAHVDRVVLLPTAETHPSGTVYVSLYEIVIPQVGVAVSDRTQITLTMTPPFGEDLAFLGDLTLKTVVVRDRFIRVAALGSVDGLVGIEPTPLLVGRAGAVVTGCFDLDCHGSLSLGSTMIFAGPGSVTANGAGLVWRATTALSFLLEVQTLLPLGSEAGQFNGIAIAPGLRLGWRRFALDLAAEILPQAEVDGTALPAAIPLLVATYRSSP